MNAITVKLGQNTIFVSIAFYCCFNDQLGCNKFIYDYLFLSVIDQVSTISIF